MSHRTSSGETGCRCHGPLSLTRSIGNPGSGVRPVSMKIDSRPSSGRSSNSGAREISLFA